jgi:hypothetical protein
MARITRVATDLTGLQLSAEDGFVLSRIEGATALLELEALTGLPREHLRGIVARLQSVGVVAVAEDADAGVPIATSANEHLVEAIPSGPLPEVAPSAWNIEDSLVPPAPATGELPELTPEEHGVDDEDDAQPEAAPPEDDEESTEREDVKLEADLVATYRALYGRKFAHLSNDLRVAAAEHASGEDLAALCFDVDPAVVRALLANLNTGLSHARLIAQHHQNAAGLDALAQRGEFVRDMQVERRLLRNPQLSERVVRALLGPKPLRVVHKSVTDRDIPELTRTRARGILRARWTSAPSEEKADLVLRTEGRVLALLTGCTFDQRMTAIMCTKTYASVILVQSIARFPAAPPALIAHLLKQSFVKRSPHLRNLLFAHPNVPSDAKRQR